MRGMQSGPILRSVPWIFTALGALWISTVLPPVRLDTRFADWVLRLTLTGGFLGITLIALFCVLLLLASPIRGSGRRMTHEIVVHVCVLGILLGGGALVNEYLLKPAFAAPRPNIVRLSEEGILGTTAGAFYDSLNKDERRAQLEAVLVDPANGHLGLAPSTREHWIQETGFSFPSGHTFAAMFVATYLLILGRTLITMPWRWTRIGLLAWAVLVGWSRVVLGVHRPADVIWGGLLGVALGALASQLFLRFERPKASSQVHTTDS